jgi:hypothetical protein
VIGTRLPASTTLANSTNSPSPVVFDDASAMLGDLGSITSWRIAFSAASVSSSSSPISRE